MLRPRMGFLRTAVICEIGIATQDWTAIDLNCVVPRLLLCLLAHEGA